MFQLDHVLINFHIKTLPITNNYTNFQFYFLRIIVILSFPKAKSELIEKDAILPLQ